jgi:serine/threonine protein kinase
MDRIDLKTLQKDKIIYERRGVVEVFTMKSIITNKIYCIKKMFIESIREANDKTNEILAMSKLNHAHLIPIISCMLDGPDRQIDSVVIIMNYYSEGDLEKLIQSKKSSRVNWSELEIFHYLNQLVSALSYMQRNSVCHRDLKPQNIFVDDQGRTLKIGDLGSSRIVTIESEDDYSIVGTPLYLSPIVRDAYAKSLANGHSRLNHNPYKSDIYSLGLIMLYMASFKNPAGLTNLNTLEQSLKQRLQEIQKNYPNLFNVLSWMLCIDETRRPDFFDLEKYLNQIFGAQTQQVKVSCQNCSAEVLNNEIQEISGSQYCQTCFQHYQKQHTCSSCFQLIVPENLINVNGVVFCKRCLINIDTFEEDKL